MGLFKRNKIVNESTVLEIRERFNTTNTISREQALSIPAVASAIDIIAGKISTIPIKLYQEIIKDGKREINTIEDERCRLLNDETGDTLDGVQFKKAMINDYFLGKGGFAFIRKVGNETKSLHYVEDDKVTITKNIDPIFKSYSILIKAKTYKDYQFIKLLRKTKDGSTSESILNEISKALQTAYLNLIMQLASAKKGGKKRGFLKLKNPVSKEILDKLKQDWELLYSNDGLNSIVLPNGAEFQESNDSTFETSVNTTRKQLNDEIKDIFHIGPTENDTFVNAIVPILAEFECAINKVLLLESEKKQGYFFAFDTKEITKGDMKSRFEAYGIAIDKGIYTPNEVRYIENRNSIDGLDVINFGLSASLYDINSKKFYTPNMDSVTSLNDKGAGKDEDEK